MTKTHTIVYVTSSPYKAEENQILHQYGALSDGTPISTLFEFDIRALPVSEMLEVDLAEMVRDEVKKAYARLRIPCFVEHAGLVFDDYADSSYPGGLTKPMWNTLGKSFISETRSAGRKVTARAVVGYCDGMDIRTFIGETCGTIAPSPRGKREFYWDNIFVPSETTGIAEGLTYAEIVDQPSLGLTHKVLQLSQSTRAILKFLEFLRTSPTPALWR